jgi:hypothetical protein
VRLDSATVEGSLNLPLQFIYGRAVVALALRAPCPLCLCDVVLVEGCCTQAQRAFGFIRQSRGVLVHLARAKLFFGDVARTLAFVFRQEGTTAEFALRKRRHLIQPPDPQLPAIGR